METGILKKDDWFYTHEANSVRFDDYETYITSKATYPKAIFYRTGDLFDNLGIEYNNGVRVQHGGTGGGPTVRFELEKDELITKMDISECGFFICGISFYTNKNRVHHAGRLKWDKTTVNFDGRGLACFYGATAPMSRLSLDGHCLTGLGVYTIPLGRRIYSHVLLDGVDTDQRWDDIIPYCNISNDGYDNIRPKSIRIWSGQFLDKIQVLYGNTTMDAHGINEPGGTQTFSFAANEYITKVSLGAHPTSPKGVPIQIGRLKFVTNLGNVHEFHSWSKYEGDQLFEYELPPDTALVALGGRFGGGINIISGLTLHYVYLNRNSDTTSCNARRNVVRATAFEGTYYKTLSGSRNPTSDVWVNTIETIDVPQECDLFCTTISCDENEIAYPNGVYTAMFGPSGRLSPKETDNEHVHMDGEKFYQMSVVRPPDGKYKILIQHRVDASVFVEYQCVLKNCNNIPFVQSMPTGHWDTLPFYGRPLQRLLIAHAAAQSASYSSNDVLQSGTNHSRVALNAVPVYYLICAFAHLHPFVTLSLVVVGGMSLGYTFCKFHNKLATKPVAEVISELQAKAKWSVTKRTDSYIYKALSSDYSPHAHLSDKQTREEDSDALALYKRLLEKNNNNMRMAQMKRITRNDMQGKKLVIDIGGEGCLHDVGIRVAGVNNALNLNGCTRCYTTGLSIPMLIHVSHWDSENFPFDDGVVDAFIMQATPAPTLKTAKEIVRCLNKQSGRFDLISNGWDNLELLCYQYIRNELGFGLYEGAEMVHSEYPHLVGNRYLTIYSAAYTPPKHDL